MYAPRSAIIEHGQHTKIFIETGTYKGETAEWASTHWDIVYTIELSPSLFKPKPEFKNISYLQGDSRDVLNKQLMKVIAVAPCTFWLDGHWFDHGENVAGTEEDCPLLEELRIITRTMPFHVIFIDDAHLIKEKHSRYTSWPTEAEIRAVAPDYSFQYIENTILMKRKTL